MPIVLFTLTGDIALWRNVYDSMGSYSTLGPAPSALAGLCGAALGFAAPRSMGALCQGEKIPGKSSIWPVAPKLLEWLKTNDIHFACRWTGADYPRRIPWNVNGCKEIKSSGNLRIQQQVIEHPCYEVAVRFGELLPMIAAEELSDALRVPAFRLFLGCSECPAIVRDVRLVDALPDATNWAFRQNISLGEVTPLTCLSISGATSGERLSIDGYWVYPTKNMPGVVQDTPFVRGYGD